MTLRVKAKNAKLVAVAVNSTIEAMAVLQHLRQEGLQIIGWELKRNENEEPIPI